MQLRIYYAAVEIGLERLVIDFCFSSQAHDLSVELNFNNYTPIILIYRHVIINANVYV